MPVKYAASLDTLSKWVTIFCCVLLGALSVKSLSSLPEAEAGSSTYFFYLLVTLLMISIPVFCYLYSIREYGIDHHALYIHRILGSVTIPFEDMASVRTVSREDTAGMIRTFGVGGLFGYYGRFYTRALKTVFLYTTQRKNWILITTKAGRKIIISPDDPGLIHIIRQQLETR